MEQLTFGGLPHFRPYTETVFSRFFKREIDIDVPERVAALITELGFDGEDYERYRVGQGAADFEACIEEAHTDHAFGVPLFVFRGEPFWGHDRMSLLEERLTEARLARA